MARRLDSYRNFAELRRAERPDVDFRIRVRRLSAAVAIIAPHGGKIEFGTSELAAAIAGHDYSLYCFEGLKPTGNKALHITSTAFDEPTGVELIAASDYVVAIHGWGDRERRVYMGGLDEPLKKRIAGRLDATGIKTESSGRMHLQAMSKNNICNRGKRRMGAQLEVSATLRQELTGASARTAELTAFVSAVRQGIFDVAGI